MTIGAKCVCIAIFELVLFERKWFELQIKFLCTVKGNERKI